MGSYNVVILKDISKLDVTYIPGKIWIET